MDSYTENITLWAEDMQQHNLPATWSELDEFIGIWRTDLPERAEDMWKPYTTEATKEIIAQRDALAYTIANTTNPTTAQKEEHNK